MGSLDGGKEVYDLSGAWFKEYATTAFRDMCRSVCTMACQCGVNRETQTADRSMRQRRAASEALMFVYSGGQVKI
jgi:hypothetical protein